MWFIIMQVVAIAIWIMLELVSQNLTPVRSEKAQGHQVKFEYRPCKRRRN